MIDRYLVGLADVLAATPRAPLLPIIEALWQTYQRDGTIFVCGNGGSAATASHFACDLSKWTIRPGQRRVRAVALTDNVPVMTAWSNDAAYERIFVDQLINLFRPGDTLVAISGSGNSPSVLRAVEWASAQGAPTIGFSAFGGGRLAQQVQLPLVVPSAFMPEAEDVHMALCHALAVNIGVLIEEHP